MGGGSWELSDWGEYSAKTATKPRHKIYASKSMDKDMNPFGVKVREARDNEENKETTPIIVCLDVSGSMGHIAEYMAKTGLGVMVNEILKRDTIPDPAVLVMANDDIAVGDSAALQVGQFESDIGITTWLEKIYLEFGGGGNDCESYDLPYYFALKHTVTDAFEKRNKAGVIITIGDERPPVHLTPAQIRTVTGDIVQSNVLFKDLIQQIRPMYTPYHILVTQGANIGDEEATRKAWAALLGQNVLSLNDYEKIAETIVTALEIECGKDSHAVIGSWDKTTSLVLSETFKDFTPAVASKEGVSRF